MIILPVTINNNNDSPLNVLRPILQLLKDDKHVVDVMPEIYDWESALPALNKIAKSHSGPVISQIGTTWVSDLVSQQVLRPFTAEEIAAVGGQEIFFPSAWKTTRPTGTSQVFSIPWQVDTNVLYYRRDALQQAGINESTAFATLDRFSETLAALRGSGNVLPWICSSGVKTLGLVHHISNWVFGRGGTFISSDGRRAEFYSGPARGAIREYFELQRYLNPMVFFLSDSQAADRYFWGQAAVVLASPTYIRQMKSGRYEPKVVENTGVAVPPGVPFVGGSNWAIWSHISPALVSPALDFLARMSSLPAQVQLHESTGQLPARQEALAQSSENKDFPALMQTIKQGRTFPAAPAWSMVENKLVEALYEISNGLILNPNKAVDALLDQYLAPVEEALNQSA